VAVASAGPYASRHLAPDRQPCQHPTTQFLQARCPSCHPTNSVKALKAILENENVDDKICRRVNNRESRRRQRLQKAELQDLQLGTVISGGFRGGPSRIGGGST